MFISGMLFSLQCYLDFFCGSLSHIIKLSALVASEAAFCLAMVYGLEWIPPMFTLYASIGFFYIIVFEWYYIGTFIRGERRMGPHQYLYAALSSSTYLLLYLGIIALGFNLKYYLNQGKLSTKDG